MGGYLVNFSVYTFAMIGFLFFAVAIYKKTSAGVKNSKSGGMEIEDSLSLSPRKRLHVVKVNGEKFLIAADTERTEFLAKLDNNENSANQETLKETNIVKLNKQNGIIQKDSKITSFSTKIQEKINNVKFQGNTVLKTEPIAYQTTRLSQVKNINMKKPPIMREILRKLEA